MTNEQFSKTAFFKGQRATLNTPDGEIPVVIERVEVGGVSLFVEISGNVNGEPFFRYYPCDAIELETPCPLAILREIQRRMNDVFGEGSQCRVDSDVDKWITETLKQAGK